MTPHGFTESIVEDATLGWLESLGYSVLHGSDIAPGEPAAERQDYGWLHDTLLPKLISSKLRISNTHSPVEATT